MSAELEQIVAKLTTQEIDLLKDPSRNRTHRC
jgi:hypothetical protein